MICIYQQAHYFGKIFFLPVKAIIALPFSLWIHFLFAQRDINVYPGSELIFLRK